MSARAIRVLIVEDQQVVRDCLGLYLAKQEGIEVVGEAGDGRAALEAVRRAPPDVVVMDVGMVGMNGIEATRQIVSEYSGVRVVALSVHSDRRYVDNMFRAGASGYVVKASAAEELVRAVQAVHRGQCYTSPEVTRQVVDASLEPTGSISSSAYTRLGPRQRQVLQLLAEGHTSPEIASLLDLSTRTVESHRRNIMEKLGLRTIAELTKYAVREGLTEIEPERHPPRSPRSDERDAAQ